jgi:hypothetical protein
MKSLCSKPNSSTVIWQARNLTSASWQSSRNSAMVATPLLAMVCFISTVATDS